MIMTRPAGVVSASPVPDVELRPLSADDAASLGRLYFEAYDPGVASATEAEALEDIHHTFDGEYGVLDTTLSRLAWRGDELVGVLLVVERAPWPDTPDCRFVIELFTARSHRRSGIAKLLLAECSAVEVALRVQETNTPALALYRAVGFQPALTAG